MSAQKITSSAAKLTTYSTMRELDRIALPLVEEHGIAKAYQMAMEKQSKPGVKQNS